MSSIKKFTKTGKNEPVLKSALNSPIKTNKNIKHDTIELKDIDAARKTETIKLKEQKEKPLETSDVKITAFLSQERTKLIKLYTVINSVCNFNKMRDLETDFYECKKSMEDLFGKRVLVEDIERLNFLGLVLCKKKNKSFLVETLFGTKETATKIRSFNGEIKRKMLFPDPEIAGGEPRLVEKEFVKPREMAISVLERIKQREAERRANFIQNCVEKKEFDEIKARICGFMAGLKTNAIDIKKLAKCIKMDEKKIEKMANHFKIEFEIRKFEKIDYLIKK